MPPTFATVAERPKCKRPPLAVPESVRIARVEGTVEITFDVSADGAVENLRVQRGLTADAEAACVTAWATTRCRPGTDGVNPVRVTDVPFTCTFKAITP